MYTNVGTEDLACQMIFGENWRGSLEGIYPRYWSAKESPSGISKKTLMPIESVVADANVLLSAVVGKAALRVFTESNVVVHVASSTPMRLPSTFHKCSTARLLRLLAEQTKRGLKRP